MSTTKQFLCFLWHSVFDSVSAKNTTEMLIYALLNTFLQEKLAVLHALVMFTVFKKKDTHADSFNTTEVLILKKPL